MANFTVKYQTVNPKTKQITNTSSYGVSASSVSEVRQKFKSNYSDTATRKHKIISIVKH